MVYSRKIWTSKHIQSSERRQRPLVVFPRKSFPQLPASTTEATGTGNNNNTKEERRNKKEEEETRLISLIN